MKKKNFIIEKILKIPQVPSAVYTAHSHRTHSFSSRRQTHSHLLHVRLYLARPSQLGCQLLLLLLLQVLQVVVVVVVVVVLLPGRLHNRVRGERVLQGQVVRAGGHHGGHGRVAARLGHLPLDLLLVGLVLAEAAADDGGDDRHRRPRRR